MLKYQIFFGKQTQSLGEIESQEGLKLSFAKQVHGDQVLKVDKVTQREFEADSLWTNQESRPLAVMTADCLPILGYHPNVPISFAVHAGWRGVQNRVLIKTLEKLPLKQTEIPELRIHIGPHIQKKSFEVHKEVALDILSSIGDFQKSELLDDHLKNFVSPHSDEKKVYLDLSQIILRQLEFFGIKKIEVSEIDTLTNSDYASFRRDRSNSRNWSFIKWLG